MQIILCFVKSPASQIIYRVSANEARKQASEKESEASIEHQLHH